MQLGDEDDRDPGELGGDDIGKRPVDFHVAALEQLGARITYENGRYHAVADRLQGAVIELPYPSVGATENTLFAAVLARGVTRIQGTGNIVIQTRSISGLTGWVNRRI